MTEANLHSYMTPVSRTGLGLLHRNTLVPRGICFIYIQLRDDATDQVLGQRDYVVRGLLHGAQISGTTDKNGILRHEYLRDDHHELDSGGATERVETYYMVEAESYTERPWVLRLRSRG
jgi:hypothetical protein